MTVRITANDKGSPVGKLADAELHFTDGPLAGLKLIGFAVWERRNGTGRNVTFPARAYSVNGERRSFSLLRPITDTDAQDRIRDLVLDAYSAFEAACAVDDSTGSIYTYQPRGWDSTPLGAEEDSADRGDRDASARLGF